MTNHSGTDRAIKALGDEIARKEAALRYTMRQRDDLKREAVELRALNEELTEQLKQAEADRDAACSYALKLEGLLEGCKAVFDDLTAGGADKCKKS